MSKLDVIADIVADIELDNDKTARRLLDAIDDYKRTRNYTRMAPGFKKLLSAIEDMALFSVEEIPNFPPEGVDRSD